MNTREIKQNIAKLSRKLDEEKAKLAAIEEEERKIEKEKKQTLAKQINDAWVAACSTIDEITTLLEQLKSVPDGIMSYHVTDKHINEGWDCSFKGHLFRYGIRFAIFSDNIQMLELMSNAYLAWGGNEKMNNMLDYPIPYPEGGYRKQIISPLNYAIQDQHEKCAALLLEKNADPNSLHCKRSEWGGASLNQWKLLGTALTLAIENKLTETAKLLVEKGAWTSDTYIRKLRNWERQEYQQSSSVKFSKDFDVTLTPFLLAVKHNNLDLVSYFIEKGVNVKTENSLSRQDALTLTSNQQIKKLILSQYSYVERLERIEYTNPIPKELVCSVSGKIMEEPVVDKLGNQFCKKALIANNSNATTSGKFKGPNGSTITLGKYAELLSLPTKEDLAEKSKKFVEQAEQQAVIVPNKGLRY